MFHILRCLVFIYYKLVLWSNIKGKEHFPKTGPAVIVSNHIALGDPITILVYSNKLIRFMAKKELFENKLLGRFLGWFGAYSVDRGGRDINAVRTSIRFLNNGEMIGIFPEGTRSRGDELKLMGGAVMIAVKGKADIIPMAISGSYKPFGRLTLAVGERISLESYYDKAMTKDDTNQILERIAKAINRLKNVPAAV